MSVICPELQYMKNTIKHLMLLLTLATGSISGLAQEQSVFTAKQGYLIDVNYNIQSPAGNLANRFGWNSALGFGTRYKFESGWMIGAQYSWMFGNNVLDSNLFSGILGPSNVIIDKDGFPSEVRLNQRGHAGTINGGRLFPMLKNNENSGIYIEAGVGFLMHRIDIFASTVTVPQITGEYEKGYDKLTGGLSFSQFVGYQHLDPKKQVNFQVGFSFQQAFTQSMRSIDFDTRAYDATKRKDYLSGFRIGITVPVYTKRPDEEQYFID